MHNTANWWLFLWRILWLRSTNDIFAPQECPTKRNRKGKDGTRSAARTRRCTTEEGSWEQPGKTYSHLWSSDYLIHPASKVWNKETRRSFKEIWRKSNHYRVNLNQFLFFGWRWFTASSIGTTGEAATRTYSNWHRENRATQSRDNSNDGLWYDYIQDMLLFTFLPLLLGKTVTESIRKINELTDRLEGARKTTEEKEKSISSLQDENRKLKDTIKDMKQSKDAT